MPSFTSRFPALLVVAGTCAMVLVGPSAAEAVPEGGPCVAEPTVQNIAYGQVVTCAIGTIGDVDSFRFIAVPGEVVTIQVVPTTGGQACVELWDPDGVRIGVQNCIVARISAALTKAGLHTILASEFQNDGVMTYTIVLERMVPPSPPARQIRFGEGLPDAVDPIGDVDVFHFGGRAGDAVSVLVTPTAGGQACVELWGPNGVQIQVQNCIVARIDAALTMNGEHTILVTEFQNNSTMDYRVDLQCIGQCPVPPSDDDVAVDFGNRGLFVLLDPTGPTPLTEGAEDLWSPLGGNPSLIASGDVDGNGKVDLIANFPGWGLWIWMNNAMWVQLHAFDASALLTGDLDGNSLSDVIMNFPGLGVWVRLNNSGWVHLHSIDPAGMATGDVDGNGRSDLIVNFTGFGLWIWLNHTSWVPLHGFDGTVLATGDLDASGQDEVVVRFPGLGTWIRYNNSTWNLLHGSNATLAATGNIDGDAGGTTDVILNFPSFGVWVFLNNGTWVALHASNVTSIVTGDLDGNGLDDVVLAFPGFGIWAWTNNSSWIQLHAFDPEGMVTGDFDGL